MRTLLIIVAFIASSLIATAQEVQVPFDRNGKVFVISKTFNEKYSIITGVDGFVEARLFKLTIDSYNLEIISEVVGQRSRNIRPLTQAGVDSLREKLVQVLETAPAPQDEELVEIGELDQSGRTALLWGSTLWSLFYYGTATSIAISGEDSSPAVPILLAGGLGYLVPALLTNNAPVTEGAASLALGGMFQGTLHGYALALLIQGSSAFDDTPRVALGLSVLTGITETVVGYVVATNTNMSEGRAGAINTTAFYGLVCGGLTSAAIFDQTDFSSDGAARLGGALALAGTAGGVLIGNAIADDQHFTSGDATMYGITGFLGAALPWVTLATINPNDVSVTLASGLGIASTIGGLWLGTELIRGKDYRSSDGNISILSLLGGGLIGLGIATAIDDEQAYPALTYAGALGGFGISLALAKPRRETKSTSALEINVNPMGPFMLQRDAYGIMRPAPFATARYRF